ncbi:hypothetical protein [Streptomyces sp. NPDC001380]|uniref:hypothetical protein n=1 Tax=Streptomyces sp. NPDC001380 TaxID=3364566 RepID=UPI0036A40C34
MSGREQPDLVAWLERRAARPLQLTIDGGSVAYPDEPNPVPPPAPAAPADGPADAAAGDP